jgi:hypothetical protein
VAPKDVDERSHTAEPDEGHDHVDGVGRRHLSPQLVGHRRFSGRVGENGRVEEGRQRSLDVIGRSIGAAAKEGVQHAPRLRGYILVKTDVAEGERLQPAEQGGSQADTLGRPLPLRRRVDGPRQQLGDVARNAVSRFGIQQVPELRHQLLRRQSFQHPLQPTGEKCLVEPCAGRLFHRRQSDS